MSPRAPHLPTSVAMSVLAGRYSGKCSLIGVLGSREQRGKTRRKEREPDGGEKGIDKAKQRREYVAKDVRGSEVVQRMLRET